MDLKALGGAREPLREGRKKRRHTIERAHVNHTPPGGLHGTHERSPQGDSLLPHLVGLMGHRLDAAQRASVVAALGDEQRFLAPAGVASESLASPLYEDDGYWRGPVWGASNVVAAEAAAACGDPKLAAEIARRFAATCVRSGFAENFDAKTAVGLRDPGYTWTAACWLILQQDWL